MTTFSNSVASLKFLASAFEKAFSSFLRLVVQPEAKPIYEGHYRSLFNDWRCFFNSFPCSLPLSNHISVCFFNLRSHCLQSLLLFWIFLGSCFFQLGIFAAC